MSQFGCGLLKDGANILSGVLTRCRKETGVTDMEINTNEVAGVTFVKLKGDIKSTTSGEVMDALVGLVKGGSNKLLINLEGVDFISSAGLRSILVAAKLLKNSNGQMRICGANESVRKVLETSGFTSLVALYTDESEALAAFA